jgi:photosystem II biogenesis protein Psp29
VTNLRTVSDTKRNFYNQHTRPINTIYRRVVEELMVEMHLLSVNADFRYDPIYALGVVTAFERFMQGYQPERDREPIFEALCQSIEDNPQKYHQDADRLRQLLENVSAKQLFDWLNGTTPIQGAEDLQAQIQAIAHNPKFKYSRLFAIGVFTLLELTDAELVKDEKRRVEALKQVATVLHVSEDKLNKDLELYRSNLEKIEQALITMADILSADRKKRQQRLQDREAGVAATNGDGSSSTSGTPQDKTPSGS